MSGRSAALVGVLAGLSAVSFAKFGTSLALPWFALVGSSTVFAVGLTASLFLPARSRSLAAETARKIDSRSASRAGDMQRP